jgi:hypothetical protein
MSVESAGASRIVVASFLAHLLAGVVLATPLITEQEAQLPPD